MAFLKVKKSCGKHRLTKDGFEKETKVRNFFHAMANNRCTNTIGAIENNKRKSTVKRRKGIISIRNLKSFSCVAYLNGPED